MTTKGELPDFARSAMLQRPPHGRTISATTKPPIVTPTFVSRTDDTPETERPRDAGAGVNSADEQVAFRMVTREMAREHITIPSARHRDPVSLVKIHRRRPDLSREAFQERWPKAHADLVAGKAAAGPFVRRCAQRHPFGSTQADPEGPKIDGITVLSFASLNDVEDYLVTADYAAIEAAAAESADPATWEFWTAVHYSAINRLVPELATER